MASIARNGPCPCGSGKKFKRCCGDPLKVKSGDRQQRLALPIIAPKAFAFAKFNAGSANELGGRADMSGDKRNVGKMFRLTQEECKEFMRTVRDDLAFLGSLNYKKPSRTEVRIASSILRRLLHEGMYQAAWTLAGLEEQPKVTATDLATAVAEVPPQYIHYGYAGGAPTEGPGHKIFALLVIPAAEAKAEGNEAAVRRLHKLLKPGLTRLFSLSEFCRSPSVVSGKASVCRVDVVRYVANKLGGVHWDNKRGEWTSPVGSRHRLLDEGHMMIGQLPAPLYEVVSIAYAVAHADDTTRFIEKVAISAPEPEYPPDVLRFREGRIGQYAEMKFTPKKPKEAPSDQGQAA